MAPFRQDIRFATTADGVRIAYAVSGRGYPLVRTAHWMTNIDSDWRTPMFAPWFGRLASRFQFFRYDQRGSGMSEGVGLPLSVEAFETDLEAVIEAAGLERFALLGPSGGGLSAIAYAAKHPERVSHLILVGGFAKGVLRRDLGPEDRERFQLGVRAIELGWGQNDPSFLQLVYFAVLARCEPGIHAFVQRSAARVVPASTGGGHRDGKRTGRRQ